MRQGQNSKRSRGRGVGGRRNVSPRHQTFDSNGPSVRIRGSAHQVHEKYLTLARDASSAGDRIAAENYFQHAEHYFRIINPDGDGQNRGRDQQNGSGDRGDNARNDHGNQEAAVEMDGGQPDGEAAAPPVEVVQTNGTGEQPDVVPVEEPAEEPGAEAPPKKRGRSGRGNVRSRGARASGRKADTGKSSAPDESNDADTGNEETPPAEE